PAEYTRDARSTAVFLRSLHAVLLRFDAAYAEEKRSYGILDFNDLERYTYRLLVKDGKPTDIALSVQKKYDAIFIDEYQDTNDLQDAIFSAIARENRFMVGDIKQSIYGFRGAVPELFSHYRDSFPVYQKGSGAKRGTIFLSDNFRCDGGVIDYSNKVFEKLFCYNSGRVPYLEADALRQGKPKDKDAGLDTRLMLINEEETSEYDAVAKDILRLLRSGVEAKDIVILLRSMTNAEKYRKALEDLQVSSQCGKGDDVLFAHPEVLLLIALLNVIDNPTRDIYLAAVLKSPLFNLTLGELALIRRDHEALSLYQSIVDYTALADEKEPVAKKLSVFFAFLERARRYAELQSSDKVIRYLFSVTPIRAVSVKYCGNCDALMAFYDYARGYEKQGFRGVHALCRLVAEVDAGEDKDKPKLSGGVDLASVRIMSIHASKGCEFHYVYLADTSKTFNAMDESRSLVYEKDLGIGLRIRESGGFIRYDTLIRRAISLKMRENRYDEEMRILYVALTRAIKQLIISASVKDQNAVDSFLLKKEREVIDHPFLYSHLNHYRDMLTTAYPDYPWQTPSGDSLSKGESFDKASPPGEKDALPPEELERRLGWRYPYDTLVSLPAKLSVSRLHPAILDEGAEILVRSEQADFDKIPLFMQEKLEASGAERGTATHLFMQFCDFEKVKEGGIDKEIDRLVDRRFITKGIAELIDRSRLAVFFASDLFKRILNAREVLREERFNVRVKASLLTQDPEKQRELENEYVLVQGVVDCLIREEDGSLVLIDYKTDRTPKDREKAEALLRERYSSQLFYYRMALEEIYCQPIKEALLYAFSIGDTVKIDP
ncbi:MAG: UvrD-helicase domain-containing protein, partial [Clostridia bacterium]|nr:UvrD-helicase domain-containing protein [Clostridia bacterium]